MSIHDRVPEGTRGDYTFEREMLKGGIYDCLISSEIHTEFVAKATGDILVAGLGAGGCLIAIEDKLASITSIDVVEREQDIADHVWSHVSNVKYTLFVDSILNFLSTGTKKYDLIYIDIFPLDGVAYRPEMTILEAAAAPRLKRGGEIITYTNITVPVVTL